jgi:hypothetical protein
MNIRRSLMGNLVESSRLEGQGAGKTITKKEIVGMWNGLNRLRILSIGGLLNSNVDPSESIA